MNKKCGGDKQEDITKRLAANDPLCPFPDFREVDISTFNITNILEAAKNNTYIGRIEYPSEFNITTNEATIKEISDILIQNNENYRDRPSDGEFFEMSGAAYENTPCQHVYYKDNSKQTDYDETAEDGKKKCKIERYDILNSNTKDNDILLEDWKIEKSWINAEGNSGYHGILFIHEKDKFLVLANRGTEFGKCEIIIGQIGSIVGDLCNKILEIYNNTSSTFVADSKVFLEAIKDTSSYAHEPKGMFLGLGDTEIFGYKPLGGVSDFFSNTAVFFNGVKNALTAKSKADIPWALGSLPSLFAEAQQALNDILENADDDAKECLADLQADAHLLSGTRASGQISFLIENIILYINTFLKTHPEYKVFFTGHSLGGYLAQVGENLCHNSLCSGATVVAIDAPGFPGSKHADITIINSKFNPINMATEHSAFSDVYCIECTPKKQYELTESSDESSYFSIIKSFMSTGFNIYHSRDFIRDSFSKDFTVYSIDKMYHLDSRGENFLQSFAAQLADVVQLKDNGINISPYEIDIGEIFGIYTKPFLALGFIERYGLNTEEIAECTDSVVIDPKNPISERHEATDVCAKLFAVYDDAFTLVEFTGQVESINKFHISSHYRVHIKDYCYDISTKQEAFSSACGFEMPSCTYREDEEVISIQEEYDADSFRLKYHRCASFYHSELMQAGTNWHKLVNPYLEKNPDCQEIFADTSLVLRNSDKLARCLNKGGDSVLHLIACDSAKGVIETILRFKKDGIEKLSFNLLHDFAVTPLMYASSCGDSAEHGVGELIKGGADIAAYPEDAEQNSIVKTALDYAIESRGGNIVIALCEGITLNEEQKYLFDKIFQKDDSKYFRKLLLQAIDSNSVIIVKEILTRGDKIVEEGYVRGLLAGGRELVKARENGNIEIEYEIFKKQYGLEDVSITLMQYQTLQSTFGNEDIAVAIAMGYIDEDEMFLMYSSITEYMEEVLGISSVDEIIANTEVMLAEVLKKIYTMDHAVWSDIVLISLYGFKFYDEDAQLIHRSTVDYLKRQFLNSEEGKKLLAAHPKIDREARVKIMEYVKNSHDILDKTFLTHILSANTAKPELYNALRETVIEAGKERYYQEHQNVNDDKCHSAYIGDLLGRMNGFVEQSIAIFRHSAPKPEGTLSLCGVDSEWYIRSFDSEKTPYEYFPPEYLAVTDLYHNFNFITQDCHVESEILDVLPDYVDKLHLLNILIYKDAQTMQDEDVPCQDFSDAPEWIPLHQNQTVIFEIEKSYCNFVQNFGSISGFNNVYMEIFSLEDALNCTADLDFDNKVILLNKIIEEQTAMQKKLETIIAVQEKCNESPEIEELSTEIHLDFLDT